MEWAEALNVLGFDIWLHTQNVTYGKLRPCVASPVKRSGIFDVSNIDVHATLVQIVQGQRLILLSSDMHRCCTILVLDVEISHGSFD